MAMRQKSGIHLPLRAFQESSMLQAQIQTPFAVSAQRHLAQDAGELTRLRFEIADRVAQGDLEQARQQAQWALELHPESPDLLVIHALVCEIQHDWDAAAQSLIKLVERQQPLVSEDVWHHLIRVQRCQGQWGEALKTAYHALRQFPASRTINQEFDLLSSETLREA